MKLESVRFRAMGPAFPNEVSIDFTAIPGKLLAITGHNLAGKSSLLELIVPGLLFRDCPTRGPLREIAGLAVNAAASPFLEGTVVNGQRYTIRHDVDAGTAGNAMVIDPDHIDGDGEPRKLLANRLVSTYDAWVKKKLPPKDVVLASLFGCTKDLGILQMDNVDRKRVFLKAVGVDQYIPLAKQAGKKRDAAKVRFDVADSRVRDEKARAIPIDQASIALASKREILATAEQAVEFASEHLAEVEAQANAIREANETARQLASVLEAARAASLEANRRLAELQAKRDALGATLAAGDEIRAAAERVRSIDADLQALEREARDAKANEEAARRRFATSEINVRRAWETLSRARATVDQNAIVRREREAHLAAAAGIPAAEQAVAEAEEKVRLAEARVAELQETRLHGADSRIMGLRDGLQWYAEANDDQFVNDAGKTAWHAIQCDDIAAEEIQKLPEESKAATVALQAARSALLAAQQALGELVQRRTRAEALVSPEGLHEALQDAVRAHDEAKASLEVATHDCEKVVSANASREDARTTLAAERATLASVASRLAELEGAQALTVAIDAQIETAREEVRVATQRVADAELAVSRGPQPFPAPELAGPKAAIAEATMRAGEARTATALAERSLQEATASEERLAVLESEKEAAAQELADWTRLANELGPDGLQALSVDAAGPEISDLTNTLLHQCVSTRFTVSVETNAKSEDSDREVCEIRVLDSENGLWTRAERLSGAGGALVGEALRWALVILTCRRWKIEEPTIVRDEAGANLEPANARAYVAMLRKAADMVGASRVLFVSQSPEIQALADARIHVEAGQVSIHLN